MTFRAFLIFVCTLVPAVSLPPAIEAGQSLSMPEAINKAGRQRMLTQRILKAYCQMGQDIRYLKAKSQLDGAVGLFESQLQELRSLKVNSDVSEALKKVESLWQPVREIVTAPPNRDQAVELRRRAEELLKAAQDLVVLIEAAAGTNQGRLVNTAGRQRMLSQRMASLYLLRNWGFDDPAYLSDYDTATREFSGALSQLLATPENTAELREALNKVSLDWKMFSLSSKMEEGKMVPALVVRSLDKILVQMNDITGMYAATASE